MSGEPGEVRENKKHPKKSGRSQGESLFYPKIREIKLGQGGFSLGFMVDNLRAFLAN